MNNDFNDELTTFISKKSEALHEIGKNQEKMIIKEIMTGKPDFIRISIIFGIQCGLMIALDILGGNDV